VTSAFGGNIIVSWTAPYNQGAAITSYKIMFRTSDGVSFVEDISICDGSLPDVVALRSCSISNFEFNDAPFNLLWGSSVYAIVIANNLKGSSATSQAGNGAVILRVPDPPQNLADVTSVTTSTQIGLTWTDGTWDGGSDVVDYKISYAVGLSGTFTTLESSVSGQTYTAISLTPGEYYLFKLQARNSVGYSSYSNQVTIRAA
jgi:hypothetical protein